MSTFDTTKNHLQTLIKQISEGKIQLPGLPERLGLG